MTEADVEKWAWENPEQAVALATRLLADPEFRADQGLPPVDSYDDLPEIPWASSSQAADYLYQAASALTVPSWWPVRKAPRFETVLTLFLGHCKAEDGALTLVKAVNREWTEWCRRNPEALAALLWALFHALSPPDHYEDA